MKKLLFSASILMAAEAGAQNKVVVQVTNFENNKGVCLVCLYDNARAFAGKGTPLKCTTVNIANKTASAIFDSVTEGTYAISVIHDVNNNRKFDTNFLGIPKEGYGASQNKLPFAAAPKFDENKFAVSAQSTITTNIALRYIL
jgi:uncharacterized protein (DUF2141 family)